MKFFTHIVLFFLLTISLPISGQWTEVNSIPGKLVREFNFLDDDTGYAWMIRESDNASFIEKTVNGGLDWSVVSTPLVEADVHDVYFYKEGEGVLLVRLTGSQANRTRLFKTVDDGMTWSDISPPVMNTGGGLGQCQFLNENIGFFTQGRTLYRTNDGGMHWDNIEFADYLLSLDFRDEEHGVLGSWDGTFGYKGAIRTTSDGGANWTETLLEGNYTSIDKVQYFSSEFIIASPIHGWSAIAASQFYKSMDGGLTWTSVEIPVPFENSRLRQVHFKDEMNGIVYVGNHSEAFTYETKDGGLTWEETDSIIPTYDSDMQLTANAGYLKGGIVGSFF